MIYILMSSDVHACMHATSFINMYEGFNLYNRFAKVVTFDAFNLIFCPVTRIRLNGKLASIQPTAMDIYHCKYFVEYLNATEILWAAMIPQCS